MDLPRLSRTVRRITILNRDESGDIVPVVVFDRGRKKKGDTRALKPIERLTRKWAEAGSTVAAQYLSRHKKANRKRRNGWMRDLNVNLVQAGRKGLRKVDPVRLFKF
jgi:hypothetical protein